MWCLCNGFNFNFLIFKLAERKVVGICRYLFCSSLQLLRFQPLSVCYYSKTLIRAIKVLFFPPKYEVVVLQHSCHPRGVLLASRYWLQCTKCFLRAHCTWQGVEICTVPLVLNTGKIVTLLMCRVVSLTVPRKESGLANQRERIYQHLVNPG